jgi:ubiquinone biosynthesis protein
MPDVAAVVGRAAVIAAVSAVHAARFAGAAAVLAARGRWRAHGRTLAGERMAALFQALGPSFIKAGQILSARPDLLSPEMAGPLARLQDALPPIPRDELNRLLAEGLPCAPADAFAEFDAEPLACGSVAQVHRATLHDGREVAVKVRRPGIVRRMETDARLLRATASLINRVPGMGAMPVIELVDEVAEPVLRQADFLREAESSRRFRRNFTRVEHVVIPALAEELCSESVLVMELVRDARKPTADGLTQAERETAALAGLRALYRMIFVDGFIHADLHPGNVFIRRWGEVVLVDFGLVAELSLDDRADFVDFFLGLVNNRGDECARILWDTAARRPPGCDRAGFDAAIRALVAEHSSLRSRDFEITRFVYGLMDVQRRFRIRGSTRFIMTVLAMAVFDGICKSLHPHCDFQREARGFLLTARYRRAAATSPAPARSASAWTPSPASA